MTANPNQHWGGENHASVSRFMTRIVGLLSHDCGFTRSPRIFAFPWKENRQSKLEKEPSLRNSPIQIVS